MNKNIVLSVKNLNVSFVDDETKQQKNIVHNISFDLEKGKVLSFIGESGSGKSVTAMSLIRLLPANKSVILADEINYFKSKNNDVGTDKSELINLLEIDADSLVKIRGGDIAVIFQDPMVSLNPVQSIGKQIMEVFELHRNDLLESKYQDEAIDLLAKVGIKSPAEKIKSYPHQISGGMQQRVMIAIALASKPKILIADEPTTSLDIITQSQILKLLKDLQQEYGMAMIFISHDLAVAKYLSDDIAVMYQGTIVENNTTDNIINNPQNSYTQTLLSASKLVRGSV